MKVWTLQHPAVLATLKAGHAYYPRPSKHSMADWAGFAKVYRWMENQYRQRCGPLPRGRELVWLWPVKPDMRSNKDERPLVRLTLDLPKSKVLLSSFDMWHQPLNDSWLWPEHLFDQPDWNAALDKWEATQTAKGITKEDTWNGIFDPGKWSADEKLQGVTSCLRPEHVLKTELFL